MTLGEKQRLFTRLVGELIGYAYASGHELTFGETYRTPEQAALNAQKLDANGKPVGVRNSLHGLRLAIDFNLFINGVWQRDGESFRQLGLYWEGLNPGCRWGGRFGDGNHFSIEHEGVK